MYPFERASLRVPVAGADSFPCSTAFMARFVVSKSATERAGKAGAKPAASSSLIPRGSTYAPGKAPDDLATGLRPAGLERRQMTRRVVGGQRESICVMRRCWCHYAEPLQSKVSLRP